jgi:hypothetical protein
MNAIPHNQRPFLSFSLLMFENSRVDAEGDFTLYPKPYTDRNILANFCSRRCGSSSDPFASALLLEQRFCHIQFFSQVSCFDFDASTTFCDNITRKVSQTDSPPHHRQQMLALSYYIFSTKHYYHHSITNVTQN